MANPFKPDTEPECRGRSLAIVGHSFCEIALLGHAPSLLPFRAGTVLPDGLNRKEIDVKKARSHLILLFCFAGTLLAEARLDKNVVYGMYSGLALLMDIYYPERPSKEFGVCLQPGNPLVPPIGYRLGERQCQSAFAPIMIEGAI